MSKLTRLTIKDNLFTFETRKDIICILLMVRLKNYLEAKLWVLEVPGVVSCELVCTERELPQVNLYVSCAILTKIGIVSF